MNASTAAKVAATHYRSIVGGLRYLTRTWPDISFAIGHVIRFMEDPREDQSAAMKHQLRYIKEMTDQCVVFPSDANMSSDIDGWKSTSGVFIFLGSSPIAW